jgi:hypothetical protein
MPKISLKWARQRPYGLHPPNSCAKTVRAMNQKERPRNRVVQPELAA